MKRENVFKQLSMERNYQNVKWGDLDERNSVADFLVYMSRYMDKARHASNPDFPDETLANIKKVTALGVACLEKFWDEVPEGL